MAVSRILLRLPVDVRWRVDCVRGGLSLNGALVDAVRLWVEFMEGGLVERERVESRGLVGVGAEPVLARRSGSTGGHEEFCLCPLCRRGGGWWLV